MSTVEKKFLNTSFVRESRKHAGEIREDRIERLWKHLLELIAIHRRHEQNEHIRSEELSAARRDTEAFGDNIKGGRAQHVQDLERSLESARKKQERVGRKIRKTQDRIIDA